MNTTPTFDGLDATQAGSGPSAMEPNRAAPRSRLPDRAQMTWEPGCLEEQLAADHPARTIWEITVRLDLSAFCDGNVAALKRQAEESPADSARQRAAQDQTYRLHSSRLADPSTSSPPRN